MVLGAVLLVLLYVGSYAAIRVAWYSPSSSTGSSSWGRGDAYVPLHTTAKPRDRYFYLCFTPLRQLDEWLTGVRFFIADGTAPKG
jgi:hypothetical protein